ncbi:alpha/beta fold hydrolase [Sphingopyxis sp. 550A]
MSSLGSRDRDLLAAPVPVLASVDLPGGARIFFREKGPAHGDPVFFLHGLGSHSAAWRGVIAALPGHLRAIAWDAPGFGGSAPLAGASPLAAGYARHLLAFADRLGIDHFHLVGSSWGAMIAAAVAAEAPARVGSLVLLVPNAGLGAVPEPARSEALAVLAGPELVLEAAPAAVAAMLTAPGSDPLVTMLAGTIKDHATREGYAQAVAMLGATDTIAVARRISAPTLVLAGREDRLAPPEQHSIPVSQAIPGSRFEMLPDCGHLLKIEAPERVASLIEAHFETAQRRQS